MGSLWPFVSADAVAADHQPLPTTGTRWLWALYGGLLLGTEKRGHRVQVICNDASYLGASLQNTAQAENPLHANSY